MDKSEMKKIIGVVLRAGELKEVKRTGWVLNSVENVESVADRTWRMVFW